MAYGQDDYRQRMAQALMQPQQRRMSVGGGADPGAAFRSAYQAASGPGMQMMGVMRGRPGESSGADPGAPLDLAPPSPGPSMASLPPNPGAMVDRPPPMLGAGGPGPGMPAVMPPAPSPGMPATMPPAPPSPSLPPYGGGLPDTFANRFGASGDARQLPQPASFADRLSGGMMPSPYGSPMGNPQVMGGLPGLHGGLSGLPGAMPMGGQQVSPWPPPPGGGPNPGQTLPPWMNPMLRR